MTSWTDIPASSSAESKGLGPPERKKAKQAPLWRLPPTESFSDFSLDVAERSSNDDSDGENDEKSKLGTGQDLDAQTSLFSQMPPTMTTYHVHRCVLANSQSEYFQRMLQRNNKNFDEAIRRKSRIELHPLASKAFPALLDFVYQPSHALDISTQTATALFYLGKHFQINDLCEEAKRFFESDLSVDNFYVYYLHSKELKEETILHYAAKFFGENLLKFNTSKLPVGSEALLFHDVNMWLRILSHVSNSVADSEKASYFVACVCHVKGAELERDDFQLLSSSDRLPYLSYHNLGFFLDAEKRLRATEEDANGRDDSELLTSIEQRAVDALVRHWDKLAGKPKDCHIKKYLRDHEPAILMKAALKVLNV